MSERDAVKKKLRECDIAITKARKEHDYKKKLGLQKKYRELTIELSKLPDDTKPVLKEQESENKPEKKEPTKKKE